MASGSEAALQRRLQPLYEAIDARNFKSAMKLANASLQKHPVSLLLKSLKALILERMGRMDEAYEICSEVKRAGTSDEQVLSTIYLVYKSLGKLEDATEAYEIAAAKCPESVDLMTMLFNSYVRQYSFVKQQQIAMKLYKKLGDPKYLFWAVCSIQLQVYCGGEGSARLLSLAEALLKKRIESNGLQHLESLLLYLSVLQQAGKVQSAIDVLDGKLGKLFSISLDRLRFQGGLEMQLGNFERATHIQMEILRSSPDDWASLLSYLDALLETKDEALDRGRLPQNEADDIDERKKLPLDEVERRLDVARGFVKELQDLETDELRRGPYLAEVEIAFRSTERVGKEVGGGRASSSSKLVADALLVYFKRFGHMVSFASDVRQYVFSVEEEQKAALSCMLHNECPDDIDKERPAKELVKLLRRKIAAYQVDEQLGLLVTFNDEAIVERAQLLVQLYVKALPLSADIDPKERGHGEELLVMAANAYCELYRRKRKLGFVLAAILTLESGLTLRRFNPQYKLMLISLYLLLGAATKAWEWCETLELKHIQLETLSHHILPSLLALDCWEEAEALLAKLAKFHDDHNKDAADLIMAAYKNGIYSKVLEFVEFKDRLENSHQRLSGRIESILLMIKELADSSNVHKVLESCSQGQDPLQWSSPERLASLTFNEDLATRPWWSRDPDTCLLAGPTGDDRTADASSAGHPEPQDEMAARLDRWRKAVRRRCLLPRMASLAVSVSSSGTCSTGPPESTGSAAEELRSLLEMYADLCGLRDNVQSLLASAETGSTSPKDKMQNQLDLLTIATFSAGADFLSVTESLSSAPSNESNNETNLPASLRLVEKLMEQTVDLAKPLTFYEAASPLDPESTSSAPASQPGCIIAPGPGVEALSKFVHEGGAWLTLCLQAWTLLLHPASSTGKKKKNKAVEALLGPQTDQIATAVQSLAASYVRIMQGIASWLEERARGKPDDDVEVLWAEISAAERSLVFAPTKDPAGGKEGRITGVVELMAAAGWGGDHSSGAGDAERKEGGGVGAAKSHVVANVVGGQRLLLNSIRQVAIGRAEGVSKLKFSIVVAKA